MWPGEVLGNKTYPLKKTWANLKSSWPISTLDGPWWTSTTWRLFCRWAADFSQSPAKRGRSGSGENHSHLWMNLFWERKAEWKGEQPQMKDWETPNQTRPRSQPHIQGRFIPRSGRYRHRPYLRQHRPGPRRPRFLPPRCVPQTGSSRHHSDTPATAEWLALSIQRKVDLLQTQIQS